MKDTMRKRSLKRKVAFLLALSMVCTFPCAISAEAALSNIGESQEAVVSEDDAVPIDSNNAIGRIEVSIGTALLLDDNVDFTVTLTSDDGYS